MNRILRNIVRQTGLNHLIETLSEKIPATHLQTLLLEIFRRKTSQMTVHRLLRLYRQNRFVRPSGINPLEIMKFELKLLEAASGAGFHPVELSPVAPLGSSSVLGPVHQNKVISSLRGVEVVADASNVLALEASEARRKNRQDTLHLCAVHRQVRAQRFDHPKFVPHFRIFCMVSAGRDEGSHKFEQRVLEKHLDFYLSWLSSIGVPADQAIFRKYDLKFQPIIEVLTHRYSMLNIEQLDLTDSSFSYYKWLQFKLYSSRIGPGVDLCDGGFVDWTQKLLSDRKERCFISAFGTELVLNEILTS